MLFPQEDKNDAYVIRTYFDNARAWQDACTAIRESLLDLETGLQTIEDQNLNGATPDELLPLLEGNGFHSFAFVADRIAIESPEFPVLVLDLFEEPGRTFRLLPETMPSVHANLWLANMDFADFADSVDVDGIFRGFPAG